MSAALILRVNGREVAVDAAPDTPLLHVLRGELGLMGTRFGCGAGTCGACAVLVDGVETMACDIPVEAVSGKSVETIESLVRDDDPIVAEIVAHQAVQCGYCLPGIVIAAKALFARADGPLGRSQIAEALDGHLCRCGTHVRILDALESVSRRRAEGAA